MSKSCVVYSIAILYICFEHIRFTDNRCREVFTVDNDSGAIRSNGGIDRERVAELFSESANPDSTVAGCILRYLSSSGHLTSVRIEVEVLDINDNSPQFTFTGGLTRYEVRENKPANSTVLIFSVSDPDKGDNGSVVDVQISGVDQGIFYLIKELVQDRETRFLRVTLLTNSTHSAIDYETHEQFNITFTASDIGTPTRTNSTTVILNIQDENEGPPVFAMTSYEVTINETTPIGQVIVQVSATDSDTGEFGIVQYTLEPSAANTDIAGLYAVDATTGDVYLRQSVASFPTNTIHSVIVHSYNGNFSIRGNFASVRITIVRVSDLPSFRIDSVTVVSHNNTTTKNFRLEAASLHYAITEGNNSLNIITSLLNTNNRNFTFMLEFDGVAPKDYNLAAQLIPLRPLIYRVTVTFNNTDREATPSIVGSLIATDTQYAALTNSLRLNITVLDVNDNPPTFMSSNFSVPENQPSGYVVGNISASDPDEGDNGTVSFMLLSSSIPGVLNVEENGSIVVTGAIDFEQTESIQLLVMAKDQGIPPMSTNHTITVEVENVNEHTPMFVTTNLTYTVYPTTSSLPLTLAVDATDDDAGLFGELSYNSTASSNASSFVSVDRQSGDITIKSVLPSASSSPYLFPVVVTDRGGLSSTVIFTVNVWTDFCRQNPCDNGAKCTNINNDYMCQCANDDYGGQNCSTIKFPCNSEIIPPPCLNDGQCTNTNDDLDYVCSCVNGYSGRNCQYNAVSFTPRSFLTYTGISPRFDNLNIALQISPKSLNGLLLYGVDDGDNFVTLELKEGVVVAHTAFSRDVRANGPLATDDSWYQVELRINGQVLIRKQCIT